MKQLSQDDFVTGMLIIGMGGAGREVPIIGGVGKDTVIGTMNTIDNSYRGSLYRVEAVDLPFMVISLVVNNDGFGPNSATRPPSTIDLRSGHRWGAPSQSIIDAMMSSLRS